MAVLPDFVGILDVRTVLLCVLFFLVFRWLLSRPKNRPPGPWGFPIVGSVPAIGYELLRGSEPHTLFGRYAAKYGPLFQVPVFNKTVIVLNDYASVKEAFQHSQLSDRPKMVLAEILKLEGVGTASGEPWVELRRFCLTVLRSFGVGKSTFEEKIGTEAEELLKEMSAFNGKPFDPKPLLSNAVSNVICSVIFGKRYNYADQEFNELLGLLGRNAKLIGSGAALNFFPALRHLPFVPMQEIVSNVDQIMKFIGKIIDSHRTDFDVGNIADFTDAYLMEIQHNLAKDETGTVTNGTSSKSAKYGHLNERNIVGTIVGLFVAGSETTATTLQWSLLYMMLYPDIQQRVQAEIDAVVGRNRLPRLADKQELDFTQAVIWEVQRLGSIIPLGVPHAAAEDTHLRGFFIPKGALLVPNLWVVFRDPKVWPDPEQFKPERFLNDDGKAVKADELIPFSTGRRSCIGEHLAKMELFIFFSYFMHQFTFKKPDNSPPLTLMGNGGATNSPLPFEVCAVKRE